MTRAGSAVAALAGLVALGGCAHVEPPSGGPEDKQPPQVLVTRPDSLAVVPRWDSPVVLVFDERISERGVEDAVSVSPRTSPVRVEYGRDELRVSLREGWRPGMIYHITVSPTLQDLFNNRLAEPVRLVFSTGPEIPDTRATGSVYDPLTGKPEVDVRVEAIRMADSLVYAAPTDSAGRFVFARVPVGEYRLRAFQDLNRNRALDAFEPRDSATVTLAAGDSAQARLGVLMPDSTAPQIASSQVNGRVLELKFDDYLDPTQVLPPARVQIVSAEGRFVPVSRIAVGALEARAERPAAADTAAAPPLPAQTLMVELAADATLEPGSEYRVTARGIRNVVGLVGDAETQFKAPEPAPGAAEVPAPVRNDTLR